MDLKFSDGIAEYNTAMTEAKIKLLPHQIPAVRRIIKEGLSPYEAVDPLHGPKVIGNVGLIIAAIRADPDIPIELVTAGGSACHESCGFFFGENGTCTSDLRRVSEREKAVRLGLEIGQSYPASKLLNP